MRNSKGPMRPKEDPLARGHRRRVRAPFTNKNVTRHRASRLCTVLGWAWQMWRLGCDRMLNIGRTSPRIRQQEGRNAIAAALNERVHQDIIPNRKRQIPDNAEHMTQCNPVAELTEY